MRLNFTSDRRGRHRRCLTPAHADVRGAGSQTGAPYASWVCRFAGNRLALAYTDRSRDREEIDGENWPDVLARPDVLLGLADPRFDASGYRAMMALALEERRSGEFGLFNDIFDDQFTYRYASSAKKA